VKRALGILLVASSVAYVLLYLGVAFARMRYPYELEWMEGGMVAHVGRVLEGRPLYAPPSLDFVSFLYPPGYYLASAAVAKLTGLGFFPLRLLSLISSLGVFALIAGLARKETGSWTPAIVAAGLFAATYARAGAWLELARLDSFYVLLLLGSAWALRHAAFRGGGVLAGLLIASAFFTKQSALVVVVPVLGFLFFVERRRALTSGIVAVVAIVVGVVALEETSGGWFGYYCFALPAHHPRLPGGWWTFWIHDLGPALPFALIGSLLAFVGRRSWFLPVLSGALLLSSWSVRSVYGAEVNNLLPAFAGVSLLAATGATSSIARDLLLAAQLAWLVYSPAALVPKAVDRAAGDAIVRRLASVSGEVFIPHHGYLARLAGKREVAHTLAMDNVFLDDRGEARQKLEDEVRGALRDRRFGAAVVESDRRYASWILEGYAPGEKLVAAPDAFWPVSGGRLRPEWLALPKTP
jgi:hypothetical protein